MRCTGPKKPLPLPRPCPPDSPSIAAAKGTEARACKRGICVTFVVSEDNALLSHHGPFMVRYLCWYVSMSLHSVALFLSLCLLYVCVGVRESLRELVHLHVYIL